uniref:Beta-lactamase-related domain-containing protein n=2 Tax=Plectus sambesii TaxID=2011161 RepID=A0A914W1N5_9BILA
MPRPHFGGSVESRFAKVEQVFRQNFADKWEAEGAAFAVYWNGKKVVDLWGGYADISCERKWEEDTLTTGFSTTKSVASICLAILIDQKLASYDDLVIKHWPEFGKNGKEHVTINMLLGHQAGLPYINGVTAKEDMIDHRLMSAKFEHQKPIWTPGTKTGYHVMTFGWLVDQLVRRIDPKHRSVGQFFREEIGSPYGLDYYIGMPKELHGRVARLSFIEPVRTIREAVTQPPLALMGYFFLSPLCHFHKVFKNMRWMGTSFTMYYNNPDLRELEMPAANGVTTARDLAKIHSLISEGKLLSESLVDTIRQPKYPKQFDWTLGFRDNKGYGFMYTKSPQGDWLIGHLGVGGQNVKIDLKNKLAFAYLTNGMKAGAGDFTRPFMNLQKALYECLEKK